MVGLVGVGSCTATMANVCLGDDEFVMEMDHLTLAEYRADSESTYPACFGDRVDLRSETQPDVPAESVPANNHGFVAPEPTSDSTSRSSGYSNISRSCYDMLER